MLFFAPVAQVVLVAHRQNMVCVTALRALCLICSGTAFFSDTKSRAPALLQVQVKQHQKVSKQLRWQHQGENVPGSQYTVKE